MKTLKQRAFSPRTFSPRTFSPRTFSPLVFAVIAAIVVFGFIFTGCNPEVTDKNVAVTGVKLDKETLTLEVGEEETLIATVLPKNAGKKTLTWISDKPEVATVTSGTVKAVGKGEATITVTSKNGKKAECKVTVNLVPAPREAVTGVTVAPTELELKEGHSELLVATIAPPNAANKGVTWTTSDSKKATVSNGPTEDDPDAAPAGTVKGIAETTEPVIITVTTEDGDFEAECEVTVTPRDPGEIAVTGVTLVPTSLNLTLGGAAASGTLTATVAPPNATDKTIRWTVNEPGKAFVTVSGVTLGEDTLTATVTVTAVKAGSATITVTTEDEAETAHCTVTVNADPNAITAVTLATRRLDMIIDDEATLTASVVPPAAAGNMNWSTGDDEVATVDQTGKVTAVGVGNTLITVASKADATINDTCFVSVTLEPVAVTGITLNKTKLYMEAGTRETLIATIEPEDAHNKAVTWKTSTSSVASVNNGVVTAGFTPGTTTTTITVTAAEGDFEATCTVAVVILVTGISLDLDTLALLPGTTHTEDLIATVEPPSATIKDVIWESSDIDVATVSVNGRVTAWTVGTATITATTEVGGKTAFCEVEVVSLDNVFSVSVNKKTLILAETDMETLYASVFPETALNKTVTWSSSDEAVATVSNGPTEGDPDALPAGRVTAVGVGNAIITATSEDGGKKGNCPLTVVIPDSTVGNLAWINSGTFTMGSGVITEPGRSTVGAENLRPVKFIKGFYMGKYEVTQAEWEAVMGAAANTSAYPKADSLHADRKMEFPVNNINWHDAILYCNKRSIKEGLNPVYTMYRVDAPNAATLSLLPGTGITNWEDKPENWSTDPADRGPVPVNPGAINDYVYDVSNYRWSFARMIEGADGYRLPTNSEWEYTCRAGTWGENYSIFNIGDTLSLDKVNFSGGAYNGTTNQTASAPKQPVPVGSYEPNAWGLYDMHGNVWEWVWDFFSNQNYPVAGVLQTDPIQGYITQHQKILRGGAWNQAPTYCRSSSCDPTYAYVRSYEAPGATGFRVVRYIDQRGE